MQRRHNFGSYRESNYLYEYIQSVPGIKNGSVLVIGSEKPWVEACALAAGAKKVVTLEYGLINSKHPQIQTMTPEEYRAAYISQKLEPFDVVVSYSSIEHSGLGRYGDALNPWGDIITIAKAWCVTQKSGILVLGVPTSEYRDSIYVNAHRIYGPHRWAYLTANWKQVKFPNNAKGFRPLSAHRVFTFQKVR